MLSVFISTYAQNKLKWLCFLKVWFQQIDQLVKLKAIDLSSKYLLERSVQMYRLPVIWILKSVGLDVLPESGHNFSPSFFANTNQLG